MPRIALVAALFVASLGSIGAHAEHCASPIHLLSGRGLLLDYQTIGCDVIADESTPTDIIQPGGTTLLVRYEGGKPIDGVRDRETNEVTGSTLTFAGRITPLRFTQGTGLGGTPIASFDSQYITISNQESLTGGLALIRVCEPVEEAEPICEERTYYTMSDYPA
ncbi:MAG TPA: hypothetical protein VM600_08795 [Actinomycetota bacterium]|nr:hypothetical protein [Actinomycetota bacterium]